MIFKVISEYFEDNIKSLEGRYGKVYLSAFCLLLPTMRKDSFAISLG